ncbi:hypothetical protein FNF28_05416 [Cafeteria roenbergensis]|uniref:Uncharacterized protein n=1 Tax=Cafeteria roenbergensis TaxID=33653 RepID=A0A5A8D8H8_CAFRO|nr:hypothetical protein FNF28_05416 [Cafeteria roenbergensis]
MAWSAAAELLPALHSALRTAAKDDLGMTAAAAAACAQAAAAAGLGDSRQAILPDGGAEMRELLVSCQPPRHLRVPGRHPGWTMLHAGSLGPMYAALPMPLEADVPAPLLGLGGSAAGWAPLRASVAVPLVMRVPGAAAASASGGPGAASAGRASADTLVADAPADRAAAPARNVFAAYALLARDAVAAVLASGVAEGWLPAVPKAASSASDLSAVVLSAAHDLTVDSVDSFGRTPLAYAAATANEEMVATLLAAGADPDGRSSEGLGPLLAASTLAALADGGAAGDADSVDDACAESWSPSAASRWSAPFAGLGIPASPLAAAVACCVREEAGGVMPMVLSDGVMMAFQAALAPEADRPLSVADYADGERAAALAAADGGSQRGGSIVDHGSGSGGSSVPARDAVSVAWLVATTLLEHRASADNPWAWVAPVRALLGDGWGRNEPETPFQSEDFRTARQAAMHLRTSPQLLALAACCAGSAPPDAAVALAAAAAWQAELSGRAALPGDASHAAVLSALAGLPHSAVHHHESSGLAPEHSTAHDVERALEKAYYTGQPARACQRGALPLQPNSSRDAADGAVLFSLRFSPVGQAAVGFAAEWPRRMSEAEEGAGASGRSERTAGSSSALLPEQMPGRSPLLRQLLLAGFHRSAAFVAGECGEASGVGNVRASPAATQLCSAPRWGHASAVEIAAAVGDAATIKALFAGSGGAGARAASAAAVDPTARFWLPLAPKYCLAAPAYSRTAASILVRDNPTAAEEDGGGAYDEACEAARRSAAGGDGDGRWPDMPCPCALWLAARWGRLGALELLLERAVAIHGSASHPGALPLLPEAAARSASLGRSSPGALAHGRALTGPGAADIEARSGFTLVEAAVASGSEQCLAAVLRHAIASPPPPSSLSSSGPSGAMSPTGLPLLSVFGAAGIGRSPRKYRRLAAAAPDGPDDGTSRIPPLDAAWLVHSPLGVALRRGDFAAASLLIRAGARLSSPFVAAVTAEIAAAAADAAAAPASRLQPVSPPLPGFGAAISAAGQPAGFSPVSMASPGRQAGAARASVLGGPTHGTVWLHAAVDPLASALERDDAALLGLVLDHAWQAALSAAPASARRAVTAAPAGWESPDEAFAWTFPGAVGRRALARALCRVRLFRGSASSAAVPPWDPLHADSKPAAGSEGDDDEDEDDFGGSSHAIMSGKSAAELLKRSPGLWARELALGRICPTATEGWEGVLEASAAATIRRASAAVSGDGPSRFVPPPIAPDDAALFPPLDDADVSLPLSPRAASEALSKSDAAAAAARPRGFASTTVSNATEFASGQGAGRVAVAVAGAAASLRVRAFEHAGTSPDRRRLGLPAELLPTDATALRAASGTLVDGGAAGAGGVVAVIAAEGLLPPPRSTFADALVADPSAAAALAGMALLAHSDEEASAGWLGAAVKPLVAALEAATRFAGGNSLFAVTTVSGDAHGAGGADAPLRNTPPFDVLALASGGVPLLRSVLWPLGCVRYLPLKPAASAAQVVDSEASGLTATNGALEATLPPMPADGDACASAAFAEPLLRGMIGRIVPHDAAMEREVDAIRAVIRGEEGRRREASHIQLGRHVVEALSARQAAALADPWAPGTPLLPST